MIYRAVKYIKKRREHYETECRKALAEGREMPRYVPFLRGGTSVAVTLARLCRSLIRGEYAISVRHESPPFRENA
jgi:hypothetical protein